MRTFALALAAFAALMVGAPAEAAATITYVSPSTSVGSSGSYTLSLTTDGTIGGIGQAQIVDWSVLLTDAHGSITLTPLNSQMATAGSPSSLTATATDLFFNFSGFGYLAFQNPTIGSSQNFICFAAATLCGSSSNATNLLVGSDLSAISVSAHTGTLLIASVATAGGVPEPSTWAMMLLGFSAIGLATRRRKTIAAIA